jgi:F-type H+-transporting ATPase subunit delta
MSLRTSATRYARALLDVAIKEADPARIGSELDAIVDAIRGDRELTGRLLSPEVPATARINAMRALAERGGLSTPLARLLVMLAERNRLELLPDLREVYRERLLEHQNVLRASVTAAAPLQEPAVQALEQRLSAVTGKQVTVVTAVDPSLIGGLVTQIGSTVYDGSIRTQLQRMKQQLIEKV